MKQLSHFNSLEAAKVLGVNVSSIKRWTDEGKLQCVKSAGGHRKFLIHHLAGFLEKNKKVASKATLFPVNSVNDLQISQHILKGGFEYLQQYILDLAFSFERDRIFKVLQGLYLAQYSLAVIYDDLIVHVLHEIGTLWESGQISVTEEHIASQNIRDSLVRLQAVIHIPDADRGIAVCMSMPDDLHDMGLKMTDHILEANGYKVLFSGARTPAKDVEGALLSFQPNRLYLSSTIVAEPNKSQEELDHVIALCQKLGVELFLGGPGFDLLEVPDRLKRNRIYNFAELEASLN